MGIQLLECLHLRYLENVYRGNCLKAHLLKHQFTSTLYSDAKNFLIWFHNSMSNAHHLQENIKKLCFKRDYVNFPGGHSLSVWSGHVVWSQCKRFIKPLHSHERAVSLGVWSSKQLFTLHSLQGPAGPEQALYKEDTGLDRSRVTLPQKTWRTF